MHPLYRVVCLLELITLRADEPLPRPLSAGSVRINPRRTLVEKSLRANKDDLSFLSHQRKLNVSPPHRVLRPIGMKQFYCESTHVSPPNACGSADCEWAQQVTLYTNFASKNHLKNGAVAIRLQPLVRRGSAKNRGALPQSTPP